MIMTKFSEQLKSAFSAFFGDRQPHAESAGEVVLDRHFTGNPLPHAALATVIRTLATEAANQNAKATRQARRHH